MVQEVEKNTLRIPWDGDDALPKGKEHQKTLLDLEDYEYGMVPVSLVSVCGRTAFVSENQSCRVRGHKK
jgi:hypothetical protein